MKWVIAITGALGALAPAAGYVHGTAGLVLAAVASVALALNKSLVASEKQAQ